jgi:hypothetical protein
LTVSERRISTVADAALRGESIGAGCVTPLFHLDV